MEKKFLFRAIIWLVISVVAFIYGFEEPEFFIVFGVTFLLSIGHLWASRTK